MTDARDRRSVLRAGIACCSLGLAGCLDLGGDGGDGDGDTGGTENDTDPPNATDPGVNATDPENGTDGDNSTDLWLPGERLHLEVNATSQPNRVKIVSGPGVAVTEVL